MKPLYSKVLFLLGYTYVTVCPIFSLSRNLNQWLGRFGNNVIQIINILAIAEDKKATIKILPNRSSLLKNIAGRNYNFGPNILPDNHYYYERSSPQKSKQIVQDHLVKQMAFPQQAIQKAQDPQQIVIHIRNGDIWNKPHNYYFQPPLEYYQEILNRHKNIQKILLVMDTQGTPCPSLSQIIQLLKKNNKEVTIQKNSTLEDDFTLLAHAHILIHSRSTFAETAGMINAAKNNHPNHLQYIPYYQSEKSFFEFYSNFDPRMVLVCITGTFGDQVQALRKQRAPLDDIIKLYNDNNQERIKATIVFPSRKYRVNKKRHS